MNDGTDAVREGAGVRWWPNWYVTRLHATNGRVREGGQAVALCGQWTRDPEHWRMSGAWQQKRLAKNPPRCKHCERRLATPTLEERDGD